MACGPKCLSAAGPTITNVIFEYWTSGVITPGWSYVAPLMQTYIVDRG